MNAATPIAAVPEIGVNCAIPKAANAITNDGINTLSPNLLACSSPNFSSKALTVPGLTCLVNVSTAITTNIAPTITDGIYGPNIKIIPSNAQNRDVPILALWFLSVNVNTAVFNIMIPIII